PWVLLYFLLYPRHNLILLYNLLFHTYLQISHSDLPSGNQAPPAPDPILVFFELVTTADDTPRQVYPYPSLSKSLHSETPTGRNSSSQTRTHMDILKYWNASPPRLS